MNASVLWNAGTKTVAITTTGSGSTGEPYNDTSSTTTTTPVTTAPAATVAASQSSSLPSGLLTLPYNHDLTTVGEKNKSVALAFIQAYGNALTSGSYTSYNALIDKYVIDDLNNYDMGYKKTAKDNAAKSISAEVKLNDSAVITKYADILKSAALSDVTLDTNWSKKYSTSTTLCYKIDLPGFFISSFSVFFEFHMDKETNTYYLVAVNI
jgi:hypothetical protein